MLGSDSFRFISLPANFTSWLVSSRNTSKLWRKEKKKMQSKYKKKKNLQTLKPLSFLLFDFAVFLVLVLIVRTKMFLFILPWNLKIYFFLFSICGLKQELCEFVQPTSVNLHYKKQNVQDLWELYILTSHCHLMPTNDAGVRTVILKTDTQETFKRSSYSLTFKMKQKWSLLAKKIK